MDTSKIIKGVVNSGRYTVTAPIVKEDYGLYLQIEGVELPETYQVDFSNSENSGTSVTMIGNADGVLIPRQFIDSGKDVFAFLYHVGENFGRTVYKFRIPNKVRPDRTNEQPTPEEQSTIDQAISALNEAVAQTAQDVIDADASAQASAESAQDSASSALSASDSAERASASATSASQSASQASASASASANSASQSAQIKSDVENLADDAQGYAESASQSATASANSATTAQGYAQSASSSAQSASGYASQAQTSAQTASAKAQDASGYAQTASGKASESAQSASQALGYKTDTESAKTASQTAQGLAESARDSAVQAKTDAESAKDDAESARDEAQQAVASISGALAEKAPVITDTALGAIASFSDGADDLLLKSLVVNIDPIQDLHGQDSPYPAGGGVNKWDGQTFNTFIPFSAQSGTRLYLQSKQSDRSAYLVLRTYDSERNFKQSAITTSQVGEWNRGYMDLTSDIEYIRVQKSSNAVSYVDGMLTIGSDPMSAYAPFENICPISGWTQVDVEQSGVNLWDEERELGIYSLSDGLPVPNASSIRGKNRIVAKPSTDYYCNNNNIRVLYYDESDNYLGFVAGLGIKTTPTNCAYIRMYLGNDYGTTYNHDVSINYPSADHDYHPYTGRSITINLGQTVYGGKLDVLSGELVIDRAMVDLGTLNWSLIASRFQSNSLIDDIKTSATDYSSFLLCSILNPNNSPITSQAIDGTIATYNKRLYALASMYADATEFKTAMSGQQLVYELAEPIEIQLTPQQVNSLLGVNNLWADSGDTMAEYRADTKLYISKKIAEAISALT